MKKALIAASIPWLCLFAGADRAADLKSLYETHQWFKLRDAVQAAKAAVNESGKKDSKRITGLGDSVEIDAVSLPALTLRIGGCDTTLGQRRCS